VHPEVETPEEIVKTWEERGVITAVPSPTTPAWIPIPEAKTPEEAASKYYSMIKPEEKIEEKLEEEERKLEEEKPKPILAGLIVLGLIIYLVMRR